MGARSFRVIARIYGRGRNFSVTRNLTVTVTRLARAPPTKSHFVRFSRTARVIVADDFFPLFFFFPIPIVTHIITYENVEKKNQINTRKKKILRFVYLNVRNNT